MCMAMGWIQEHQPDTDTVVCSDSQSLLKNVANSADTAALRQTLDSLNGNISLQWVPSHIEIPGNEYADRAAKEARLLPAGDDLRVPFGVARAVIKREIRDPPPGHPTVSATYANYNVNKDRKVGSRREAALLAQLRSGHCLRLGHYINRVCPEKSATCLNCNEEDETVQHWITCPATRLARSRIFDSPDVGLGILTKEPGRALTYAEATLRS